MADEPVARVLQMTRGKISLARGIYCCPVFFHFPCPTSVSIFWRICTYIHISDCVQTVCELPLLLHNTAVKFYGQIGAVRSVDRIFIVGAPAWANTW